LRKQLKRNEVDFLGSNAGPLSELSLTEGLIVARPTVNNRVR